MKLLFITLLTLLFGKSVVTPPVPPVVPHTTPSITITVTPTPHKTAAYNTASDKVIPAVAQQAIDKSPVLEKITPTPLVSPTVKPTIIPTVQPTSTPTPTPAPDPIDPPVVTIMPWPSIHPCPPRLPVDRMDENNQSDVIMPCLD